MYKHVSISQQKKHVLLLQWTEVKRTTLWLNAIIQMPMVWWEKGYHIWWGCVPGLMRRYHGWWERVLQGLMGVPYMIGVPGPIVGDTRLMGSGYHTQFTAGTSAILSLYQKTLGSSMLELVKWYWGAPGLRHSMTLQFQDWGSMTAPQSWTRKTS